MAVRTLPGMPATPQLEDYADKYKDIFTFDRSDSGVLQVKWHQDGDTAPWSLELHRSLPEMLKQAGSDVENEVFVIGGTGDNFMQYAGPIPRIDPDPETGPLVGYVQKPEQIEIAKEHDNFFWLSYEHVYYDGSRMIEALVNDIEVPTVGVLNGPGFHAELALLCDITLMAEDATIRDPHINISFPPGDGIQIAMRMAMGYKRSSYAMLTQQEITAEQALDYGMVSEILPKDQVYDRALEIAEDLAGRDRILRRVTTQLLRQPLREQVVKELRYSLGSEMFAAVATANLHRTKD